MCSLVIVQVAAGDPKNGHSCKFLSVLSQEGFEDSDYVPDDLTRLVLDRVSRTGSLYDDEIVQDDLPNLWDSSM
jgi:hypothetical protein